MSPTFVFVAGSWHPSDYFQPLIRTLADAGYASVAVTPRCVDSSPPAASFQPDADALKEAVVGKKMTFLSSRRDFPTSPTHGQIFRKLNSDIYRPC